MKLKDHVNPEILMDYGFVLLDDAYKMEAGIDEYHTLYYFNGYVLWAGHSRRGQFYYIIVQDGIFYIYASKPDGTGAKVQVPNALVKLVSDGLIDES